MNSKLISNICIKAMSGDTSQGYVLEQYENLMSVEERHACYKAVAHAYYNAITEDAMYLPLTKEMCLRDMALCASYEIQHEEDDCADILAIVSYAYDPKEKALETLELINICGYKSAKYDYLKGLILDEQFRKNRGADR